MFGNHGLCGLLEEGAHEKSPKCLGGNLGDFGGILQRSQPVYWIDRTAGSGGDFAGNTGFGRQFLLELVVHVEHIVGTDNVAFADFNGRRVHHRPGRFGGGTRQHPYVCRLRLAV